MGKIVEIQNQQDVFLLILDGVVFPDKPSENLPFFGHKQNA